MRTKSACVRVYTRKSGAKVQQIFGMYKNFMQKIKFICSFCVKGLSFAQLCDSTFGGFLIYKGVPKVRQILLKIFGMYKNFMQKIKFIWKIYEKILHNS